ncbi:hypothetical protein P3X46_013807 [Hevea brasiliensis]|uniref:Jacalin-type lectin domain-containing protein n=1 Tax=Hevea brasiliensis TaxID=3981 RepID=A0ABQ9M6R0_HEVBR|nr:inactive protein RESTRICTED TEV MOVEMENT 1 [Hevea brasiliensis]KAJ9175230.1 hypothetical protein P3X46_013807 [Hevea brasiliensis]
MFKIKSLPAERGKGDMAWDEKGHSEISQIFISLDRDYFSCIQFQYFENGSLVLSPPYGAYDGHGPTLYTVQFNYPSEFLTRVSGKYTYDHLRSITFTTNKGTYGPYGGNNARHGLELFEFNFNMGENKQFGGFHGLYHSRALRSIGVYINPSATTQTSPGEISESKADVVKLWT